MPGSCTACLSLITSDGHVHVLNLGDSRMHIIRGGATIFGTREQQHFFNCPYQLGLGSDNVPADADYCVLVVSVFVFKHTYVRWNNWLYIFEFNYCCEKWSHIINRFRACAYGVIFGLCALFVMCTYSYLVVGTLYVFAIMRLRSNNIFTYACTDYAYMHIT